jgi:molybdopterin-guanine dinucleotide biosynthesis protein A
MQKLNSNNPVGIILAGGLSRRMGSDKALLNCDGVTMLDHCQTLLRAAGIGEIMVSRNVGQGIRDVIEACGPLGGIYSVLAECDVPAVIIVPIDMPLLQADDLRQLLTSGQMANRPVYFDDCYLPLYLPINATVKAYLHQQLCHDGDRSVKGLIKHFSGGAIAATDKQRLINTNTPQQWQAWQ